MGRRFSAVLLITLIVAIAFYAVPFKAAVAEKQVKRDENVISPDLAKAMAALESGEDLRVIILIEGYVGMSEAELKQKRGSIMSTLAQLGAESVQAYKRMNLITATLTAEGIRALAEEQGVAAIKPDRKWVVPPVPDKKLIDKAKERRITPMMPWVDPHITATVAWAQGINGSGVTVAVIDTGVNFAHPDLAGRESGFEIDFTGEGYFDRHGHGTFCASEIASQNTTLYTFGGTIIGVAYGAKIMGVKVLNSTGWGWDSWVIAGIEWAWLHGADIISMSLGGLVIPNDGSDPVALALAWAHRAGVLPVVAAGNEGPGQGNIATPGSSPFALTVGASTLFEVLSTLWQYWPVISRFGDVVPVENDQMIDFTSRGPIACPSMPKPDIAAPGAWVLGINYTLVGVPPTPSRPPEEAWDIWAGTSMSTPIVAGAAALVLQALRIRYGDPGYRNPDQIRDLLKSTSEDLGYDVFTQGSGRVRAGLPVLVALRTEPGIYTSPSSATFWPITGNGTRGFTITNFGSPTPITNVKISSMMYKDGKVLFQTSGIVDGAPIYDPISGLHHRDFWYSFTVPSKTPAIRAELMVSKEWALALLPQGYMRIALYNPAGELINYNLAGTYWRGGRTAIIAASPSYLQEGAWTVRVYWYWDSSYTDAGRIPFQVQVTQILRATVPGLKITPTSISSIAPGGARSLTVKATAFTASIEGAIVVSADGISPTIIPITINPIVKGELGTTVLKGGTKFGVDGWFGEGDWQYYYFLVSDTKYVPNLMASVEWKDLRTDVDVYLAYVSLSGWGEGYWAVHSARLVSMGGEGNGTMSGGKKDFAYVADPYPTGKLPNICGLWMLILHTISTSNTDFKGDPLAITIDRGSGKIAPSPTKIDLKLSPESSKTVTVKIKNLDVVPASYYVEADQRIAPLTIYWTETQSGILDTLGLYGYNGWFTWISPSWPWDQAVEGVLTWGDATVMVYDYAGNWVQNETWTIGTFNMSLTLIDPDVNIIGFAQDDDGDTTIAVTPVMLSPVRWGGLLWPYYTLISVKSNDGTGDPSYVYRWIVPFTLTINWYTTLSPWEGWCSPLQQWIDPVAPGRTASFTVTIKVPSGTPPGTYSGYILVWDDMHNFLLAKIPVTITVP